MKNGRLISKNLKVILPLVDQFVEATSFERHALWKEFESRNNWNSSHQGLGICVGSHNTHILFVFDEINGKLIAFYEPTSSVVYWDEVKQYILAFEKPLTNATNYYPLK